MWNDWINAMSVRQKVLLLLTFISTGYPFGQTLLSREGGGAALHFAM